MANGNDDTARVKIPGLSLGGAIQISNATMVTAVLGGIALTLVGCHFLNGHKKAKKWMKNKKRMNPDYIENKVFSDVMSFAANVNPNASTIVPIRNMVHRVRGRIKDLIQSYRSGDITAQEFDASVRNLYPLILDEMDIPPNSVPQHVVNQLDATIERVSDKILSGQLPVKIKTRMYKNHPGLATLHELGRERALSQGLGNKYGLKRKMAMHTNAGVYLKDANYAGWMRPEGYYGAWIRPDY